MDITRSTERSSQSKSESDFTAKSKRRRISKKKQETFDETESDRIEVDSTSEDEVQLQQKKKKGIKSRKSKMTKKKEEKSDESDNYETKEGSYSDDKVKPRQKKQPLVLMKTRSRRQYQRESFTEVEKPAPSKRQRVKKSNKTIVEAEKVVEKSLVNLGKNESGKLLDPAKSPHWDDMLEVTREKLLSIREKCDRLTQVWESYYPSEEDDVKITAVCLEDVYMDRYISAEVIDWVNTFFHKEYASSATQERMVVSLRADSYELLCNNRAKQGTLESLKSAVERKFLIGERYLLAPMLSSEDHWTLLYFDLKELSWHHYNSLGSDTKRMSVDFKAATEYMKMLDKFVKPTLERLTGMKLSYGKKIERHEEPRQNNPVDCGVCVGLYANKLSLNQLPNFGEADLKLMRSLWTNEILGHAGYSLNINCPPDALHDWFKSPEGQKAIEEDEAFTKDYLAKQELEKAIQRVDEIGKAEK